MSTGTSGWTLGRTQPAAALHPGEWRGACWPEARNREKVPSHQWWWPSQAPASKAGRSLLAGVGNKSLILELTKFMERVVGDGRDCSRDLSSVAVEILANLAQGRRGTDKYNTYSTIRVIEGQAQGSCIMLQRESLLSWTELQQGWLMLANT